VTLRARYNTINWKSAFSHIGVDLTQTECIFENFEFIADMFRPFVDCSVCNITGIDRVSNISQKEFLEKYAYSGRPVVITDGAKGWPAADVFSFEFFKELYGPDSPNLDPYGDRDCQFFPYQTNFESLNEVFDMSEERQNGVVGKPWYIGWSNCDSSATNVLRRYYNKPYFLTATMEASKTDWIFMGSPGYGAHLHIDAVDKTSWQAQIKGRKEWTLEPPPECYFKCPSIHTTILETGDILVVDTMKWFHKTRIVGDEMSITIGSEFD
jgi:hypothetical protein